MKETQKSTFFCVCKPQIKKMKGVIKMLYEEINQFITTNLCTGDFATLLTYVAIGLIFYLGVCLFKLVLNIARGVLWH